ncbi:MAG: FHA domain-containing protein [Hyphomicrobiaceae bacterium]|nr:FHA domain-containing protein [Hyphomicrobiaceae bacterium]
MMNQSNHGDDPNKGSEDATHIVQPGSSDDEATRILPMRSSRPGGQGTVIGVAAQQARNSGEPSRPGQGAADGDTPKATPAETAPSSTSQSPASVSVPPEDTDAESKTVFLPSGFDPPAETNAEDFDPAVGWLVVMEGPGRGKNCAIYYGQNAIGRGPEQRIRLNFGDNRIARDTHAFVIYDDVARTFYIRDNGKTNLVRLNGAPVLTPMKLNDRDKITIGSTVMMFVALCGESFDWLAASDGPATAPGA